MPSDQQTTIHTDSSADFWHWRGSLVRIGGTGRASRIYPISDTEAALYPDWPGRNRAERRKVAAEARHAR